MIANDRTIDDEDDEREVNRLVEQDMLDKVKEDKKAADAEEHRREGSTSASRQSQLTETSEEERQSKEIISLQKTMLKSCAMKTLTKILESTPCLELLLVPKEKDIKDELLEESERAEKEERQVH